MSWHHVQREMGIKEIAVYSKHLQQLRDTGSLRRFRPLINRGGGTVGFQGAEMLNMTSNDYLGIGGNTAIHQDFYAGKNDATLLERYGLGAASSRLLTGDSAASHDLERIIRECYSRPGCLLFNSGYHANIGILPALTTKKDLIVSDKLNHASIHDGLRLSRADCKRFRHTDYDHLAALLEKNRGDYERVFIVSESVFSMDGDEADLHRLVELKNRHDCLLYVDEAHGVGVYGSKGLGKAEQYDVMEEIDLLVGTFGKAFASVGAYVVCSEEIVSFLVNFSRSLIFTTALPPVVIHWNRYIFQRVVDMAAQRRKLEELSSRFRASLVDNGLHTAGSTNIVPVIIGDNAKTVQLAEKMQGYGYLVFAVRPPTVPQGTARFRLSLTADMNWEDIRELPIIIKKQLLENEI